MNSASDDDKNDPRREAFFVRKARLVSFHLIETFFINKKGKKETTSVRKMKGRARRFEQAISFMMIQSKRMISSLVIHSSEHYRHIIGVCVWREKKIESTVMTPFCSGVIVSDVCL